MNKFAKHKSKSMPFIRLFLFVFVVINSLSVSAQDASAIIKKYIDYIGGRENWKSAQTLTTSGFYNYGGMEFPFRTYAKSPDRYKFKVEQNGKYYEQGFNGKTGWKIDTFNGETEPTILTGSSALAMSNESDVELEDVFIDYERKGHTATFEGIDTIRNTVCYKIKFIRKDGIVDTCYFNSKTSTLVMRTTASKNPELQGGMLNIYYSDYRDVDGIKIPFETSCELNGQPILHITVIKAAINPPVDDTEFKP